MSHKQNDIITDMIRENEFSPCVNCGADTPIKGGICPECGYDSRYEQDN